MLKEAIEELTETLEIIKKYEDHIPPTPEAGNFYATFNNSIVYICPIDDDDYDTKALIIKGGCRLEKCGDTYFLSEEGYHINESPGPHVVMGLREKLDITLPDLD